MRLQRRVGEGGAGGVGLGTAGWGRERHAGPAGDGADPARGPVPRPATSDARPREGACRPARPPAPGRRPPCREDEVIGRSRGRRSAAVKRASGPGRGRLVGGRSVAVRRGRGAGPAGHVRRLAFHQEAGTRSGFAEDVVRVGQDAGVQGQAAAADAVGEVVAQPVELLDALVQFGAPGLARAGPSPRGSGCAPRAARRAPRGWWRAGCRPAGRPGRRRPGAACRGCSGAGCRRCGGC